MVNSGALSTELRARKWKQMSESNTRPLGYEPSALPLRQSAVKENVPLALYLGCDLS